MTKVFCYFLLSDMIQSVEKEIIAQQSPEGLIIHCGCQKPTKISAVNVNYNISTLMKNTSADQIH